MTHYRRNFVPGGSFFFTVALVDRSTGLLTAHIERLRTAFRQVRDELPFRSGVYPLDWGRGAGREEGVFDE
jgi:REP element-mobilizing transposase RayT